jgi:hypothetical protein
MEPSLTAVLRPGLLDGLVVARAGGAEAIGAACAQLGAATPPLEADLLDEVALLAAYLSSEAGDYFSGCGFRLGAVAGSSAQGTSTESSVGASRATTY